MERLRSGGGERAARQPLARLQLLPACLLLNTPAPQASGGSTAISKVEGKAYANGVGSKSVSRWPGLRCWQPTGSPSLERWAAGHAGNCSHERPTAFLLFNPYAACRAPPSRQMPRQRR